MKKYKVTMWRTTVAIVEVEAEDKQDAIDQAASMSCLDEDWNILDDNDYQVEEE